VVPAISTTEFTPAGLWWLPPVIRTAATLHPEKEALETIETGDGAHRFASRRWGDGIGIAGNGGGSAKTTGRVSEKWSGAVRGSLRKHD
jgi:hypothetical protein